MAKSKPVEETEVEEKILPVKVNLGDTNALKNALDEIAGKPFLDCGFTEDLSQENIKILLGVACSCFGLFGQFHHWVGFPAFPDDGHILLLCVLGYVVFSSIMTVLLFFNGSCIFRLVAPADGHFGDSHSYLKGVKTLNVITNLPRFDGVYELLIEIEREDGVRYDPTTHPGMKSTQSLGEFFTEDGFLVEANFTKFLCDAMKASAKAAQPAAGQHSGKKQKAA